MGALIDHILAAGVLAVGFLILIALAKVAPRLRRNDGEGLILPLLSIFLGLVLLVAVIIVLPLGDSARGQVLSLIAGMPAAIIALSSTAFVACAIADII